MKLRQRSVIIAATLLIASTGTVLLIDQSTGYAAKLDDMDRHATMKIIDKIRPLAPAARIVQGDQSSTRSWIVATLPLPRKRGAFEIGSAIIDLDSGILHSSFKTGAISSERDMTADQFGREVQKRAVNLNSASRSK